MGKKKGGSSYTPPPVDYKSMWKTYDRWKQEDAMAAVTAGEQMTKREGRLRARLGASGQKPGSVGYDMQMEVLAKDRLKMVKEQGDAATKLKTSLTYKDLQAEFKKQKGAAKSAISMAKFSGMGGFMMGIGYNKAPSLSNPRAGSPMFGFAANRASAPNNMSMMFGGAFAQQAARAQAAQKARNSRISAATSKYNTIMKQTFEEWGASTYGAAEGVENPLQIEEEDPATGRAKEAASGRASKASSVFQTYEDEQKNPWI